MAAAESPVLRGAGDFAGFVKAIETRLISYLRYTTGSASDAEDLFQEVCIKLHGDWSTVARHDKPNAWVFRVAHNLAVNRFKRKDTERRAFKIVAEDARPAGGSDAAAQAEERARAVAAALAELPQDQREAVCQKVWGDCSWVEIAGNLGVSEDTAARLFARGLKALGPKLAGLA
ncbi:MAG: RNA polymerase sigma factor [Planctomycetes bacterium]|nr:RNA polymerase sigma factor [Planctomycetota bacterium]